MGDGPSAVQVACESAVAALAGAFAASAVTGSVAEWAAAVGSLQRVVDVASAAQDAAIVRLAAIETELLEDGTLAESHRALGYMALDAPAIVSGVLSVTATWAERRVRSAVRLAADGPVGTDAATGLGGLHEAMAAGRLDAYRASVVAEELEEAPAEVRATVVAALDEHFESEDATHLRRRCRRSLARISPDLLRQRARRARAESSLRRWAEEPGVDKWEGTFPSEEAARAWAAIDELAQRYVADEVCSTIGRARAKALTDLVAGNATVETTLILTVPAAVLPDGDEPVAPAPATPEAEQVAPDDATPQPAAPDNTSPDAAPQPDATRPAAPGTDEQPAARAAAGGSSEAGGHTVPDSDPPDGSRGGDDTDSRLGAGADADAFAAPDDDLVEVTGANRNEPVLVSLRWLTAIAGVGVARLAGCHPGTGALLDLGRGRTAPLGRRRSLGDDVTGAVAASAVSGPGADGYRPTRRLAELVRARDRRCRFPGCAVAARFCDLDHVRPWPRGRTAPDNLICVCRRHHRIKQRPGWRVVLARDGVTTWVDPTGRVRTTAPADALRSVVITHAATSLAGHGLSPSRTVLPDGPHSALEFRLEHLAAAAPEPAPAWNDHRGRHGLEVRRARGILVLEPAAHRPRRSARIHRRVHGADDVPPF